MSWLLDDFKKDKHKTKVIFRRFKDSRKEVIALFPEINYESGDCNFGYVQSYMHVGQHGEADYTQVVNKTTWCEILEPDVRALFVELEGLGYNLESRQRNYSK